MSRSRSDSPAVGVREVPTALRFTKMCGSGNDFIVIDSRDGAFPDEGRSDVVRRLCRRRFSIGADGVVVIERANSAAAHFRWRYYNADGSEGDMCGNGAMCGARFAFLHGIAPARCTFETPAGLLEADVEPDSRRVSLRMVDPGPANLGCAIQVMGQRMTVHAITVGVPHVVVMTDDADAFAPGAEFLTIGRAIRSHPLFPHGTNVNVIAKTGPNTLRMRTYERGVEDETLACGTGAVASAVIATALGFAEPPVTVMTTGGLPLAVQFQWDGTSATNVYLGGEARVIASGVIDSDALG